MMARFWVLAFVVSTCGCVGAQRAHVVSLRQLGHKDVLVVGKVTLEPPWDPAEQRFSGLGSSRFKNDVYLLTSSQPKQLRGEPSMGDYADRIEAELGEMFFINGGSEDFWIYAGVMPVPSAKGVPGKAYLPGSFRVRLRASGNARAIYIGHLRFHRNEFSQIVRVQIIDEFPKAKREVRRTIGDDVVLKKALVRHVRE